MGTKTCCNSNQTDGDSDLNFKENDQIRKSITVNHTEEYEIPNVGDFQEHASAYM